MGTELFPNAFRFLSRQVNLAADDALAEALPDLEGDAQQSALSLLLRRGHLPSLGKVVHAAMEEDGALRSSVFDNLTEFSTAISNVIRSSSFIKREVVISILTESRRIEAAPVLSEALRLRCQRTRSLAALALREITSTWLANRHDQTETEKNHASKILADALSQAIDSWERHLQIGALEAVSWLGWHLAGSVAQKLHQPRTRMAIPMLDLIASAKHANQAEFLVCALGIETLRSAAAKAIGLASSDAMRGAILSAAWLLADREVSRGCRWIKQCSWLGAQADDLLKLEAPMVESALKFVGATGLPESDKASFFACCMQDSRPAVQRAAFWQLCENTNEPSTDVLQLLVSRRQEPFVFSAESELYRRGMKSMPPKRSQMLPMPMVRSAANEETPGLDAANGEETNSLLSGQDDNLDAVDKLKAFHDRDPQLLLRSIRSKLASSSSSDRLQGLKVISQLKLESALMDSIYKLACDHDNQVRSTVMSMLVALPGPTSIRLLRGALYDADPRVQANAVESMDSLNFAGRVDVTKPLLSSPNSRVRANAVKSLLKLEIGDAAEALLDMLDEDSRSQRLSALWVVERLKLRSLFDKLDALSEGDPDPKIRRRASRVMSGLAPVFDSSARHKTGTVRPLSTSSQKGSV